MRYLHFDILRIVAILGVIVLHASCQLFDNSYPSANWYISAVYNSVVHWCVPVFVMISGALFLNKDIQITRLWKHNISRIVCAYFFWSVIYNIFSAYIYNYSITLKGFLLDCVNGYFHLWFLKMLFGLYVIVPILKIIAANRKTEQYFLVLAFIVSFIMPTLFNLIGIVSMELKDFFESNEAVVGIRVASGYSGYFILGHYIYSKELKSTSVKWGLGALGILSFVGSYVCTILYSNYLGYKDTLFLNNFSLFTLFEALTIFTLVINIGNFGRKQFKQYSFITNASKMTFGVYLVHPLVMSVLMLISVNSYSYPPQFFILVYSGMVFLLSYAVVYILSYLPLIKNLI